MTQGSGSGPGFLAVASDSIIQFITDCLQAKRGLSLSSFGCHPGTCGQEVGPGLRVRQKVVMGAVATRTQGDVTFAKA